MSDDGRLELDDLGRVVDVDPAVPPPEPLAHRSRAADRLVSRLGASRLARARPAVRRAVAVGTVLAALALTGHVTAARPAVPVPGARVTGLSLDSEPAGAAGLLVATYRVSPTDPRTAIRVEGVAGPGIRASGPRGPAGPGAATQVVGAVPDCANPVSLDPPASGYLLDTVRTGPDGRTVRERIAAPDGIVDWASSVRRACWATAARALEPVSLAASVARDRRQVVLDVGLRNGMGRDVEVRAVDIADVATLEAADGGEIRAGGTRALRVRLPVTDCTGAAGASGASARLWWAVGPAGRDPVTVVAVPLSAAQAAAVARAARAVCGAGPTVTARLLDAWPAPSDLVAPDGSGAALLVRLHLTSDASRLVLGEDTTNLTADARVAFPLARVTLRDRAALVTLTWNAPCPPGGSAPPVLSVLAEAGGRSYARTVTLTGDRLARAYAAACGVDPAVLRSRGWAVTAGR